MLEIGTPKRVNVDGESFSEPQTIQLEPNNGGVTSDHPLNNKLVLGVIFDHLPQKYWTRARLVNKTWHSILQSKWRDEMLYKFGLGDDYPCIGSTSGKWNSSLFQFLEQQLPVNNPDDPMLLNPHPIRNISVGWSWNDNYIPLMPAQNQFWELHGHNLKHIMLDRVLISQGALLKRLLFEMTPCLEEFIYWRCVCDDMTAVDLNTATSYTPPATFQRNLKYLNVSTVNGHQETKYGEYKRRFPISWMEFFSVFPNVQKLTLEIDRVGKPSNMLKLFTAIDIIRKANNNEVLNITDINIPEEIGFSRVSVIKNISLLASLPISILHMDVTRMRNNQIIVLVSTFQSTLRDLILKHPDRMEPYLPPNVLPQGLTKLRLLGKFFSSLKYLSYTPNLEVLELLEDEITSVVKPEGCADLASITPLVNLKKLAYTKYSEISEGIEILSKLMPNVTSCECMVDTEGFRLMCQRWTNLEHLELEFKFFNEDTFLESLTQLKHLKSLKIDWYEVSDESVFEGLLMMPSLTSIELPARVLINDKALEALEAKMCVDFVRRY